ncbi:hypothetical protein [Aristophania vespae]|uniref:hypothetical protein n=1 Tax=Aristophania vespae TaxID=2697033 RepID=UPI0023516759|nr:hypothetical protein [Aristophania vespae]
MSTFFSCHERCVNNENHAGGANMNKRFMITVAFTLTLAGCSGGGSGFNGPKADMTASYPDHTININKSHHKNSADKVPFLSMPADTAQMNDTDQQSHLMVNGMDGQNADITPHPAQTDTEVSYGAQK